MGRLKSSADNRLASMTPLLGQAFNSVWHIQEYTMYVLICSTTCVGCRPHAFSTHFSLIPANALMFVQWSYILQHLYCLFALVSDMTHFDCVLSFHSGGGSRLAAKLTENGGGDYLPLFFASVSSYTTLHCTPCRNSANCLLIEMLTLIRQILFHAQDPRILGS